MNSPRGAWNDIVYYLFFEDVVDGKALHQNWFMCVAVAVDVNECDEDVGGMAERVHDRVGIRREKQTIRRPFGACKAITGATSGGSSGSVGSANAVANAIDKGKSSANATVIAMKGRATGTGVANSIDSNNESGTGVKVESYFNIHN